MSDRPTADRPTAESVYSPPPCTDLSQLDKCDMDGGSRLVLDEDDEEYDGIAEPADGLVIDPPPHDKCDPGVDPAPPSHQPNADDL
jgi:hypothetical protein